MGKVDEKRYRGKGAILAFGVTSWGAEHDGASAIIVSYPVACGEALVVPSATSDYGGTLWNRTYSQ